MRSVAAGAVIGMLAATLAMAEERRELGAHEHGHSTLAIAVEGARVAMELHAPGMDVLGFEHAAESEEQKAAVERAKAALAEPTALFVLPQAAGCRTTAASVELEAEEHEHEEGHAELKAEYTLDCRDPAELASITFAYFDRFPNAQEVEVTLLTERGQTVYEVTRARPRIVLDGLM